MTPHDDVTLDSLADDGTPPENESLDLVHRAQGGDGEAFDALVRRHLERIRRIVRIRLRSRADVRLESMDIVQDALLVVHRRLREAQFDHASDVLHWMTAIAVNQIRDAERYFAADKRRERPLRSPTISSPGTRAAKAEIRDLMDAAMADLSEEHREVILLRDYYGAPFERVARELSRSEDAARELHRRAWTRLTMLVRRRLAGRGGAET